MTDEELQLYKDLQPLFKEKMGDWWVGDLLYDDFDKWIKIITSMYGSPHCETVMLQKMGSGGGATSNKTDVRDSKVIWLPRTIDDRNPERGLWGMVNWGKWNIAVDSGTNQVIVWDKGMNNVYLYGSTPTFAILQALKAQNAMISRPARNCGFLHRACYGSAGLNC